MRLIFTILLFITASANATVYYVSNAGSDAANGTTTGTSWQTIAKVNSFSFAPGDTIKFKCGDSWNEKLQPATSGTLANRITFTSYGTGAQPLITGFQNVTGWANEGGNIWSSTFSNSVKYQNTVKINGVLKEKGRFPNTGWLTFTSYSNRNQITGSLTGTPNYTGGEAVIRTNAWIIEHPYITSQSGGTLNLSYDVKYQLGTANSYFIQNIQSVLDVEGEWSYDTVTKKIYVYALTSPTDVKASTIDTTCFIDKNYITITGLSFEGSNNDGVAFYNTTYSSVLNSTVKYSGGNGISGALNSFLTVSYNDVQYCWNIGISPYNSVTYESANHDATITHNSISNIGLSPGMGSNTYNAQLGILSLFNNRSNINYNSIKNTGYIGIYFSGDTSKVKYNRIDSVCLVKDDGGGIHTWMASGGLRIGQEIVGNIITNVIGNISGAFYQVKQSVGIYADLLSTKVRVDSNFVKNTDTKCFFALQADHLTITNNTFIGSVNSSYQRYNTNIVYNKNIMYGVPAGNSLMLSFGTGTSRPFGGKGYFIASDSNYFVTADTTKTLSLANQFYSLKRWQDSTALDINSYQGLPPLTTGAPAIALFNPTMTDSTFYLDAPFIDLAGTIYLSRVIIKPFHSKLLFPSSFTYRGKSNFKFKL